MRVPRRPVIAAVLAIALAGCGGSAKSPIASRSPSVSESGTPSTATASASASATPGASASAGSTASGSPSPSPTLLSTPGTGPAAPPAQPAATGRYPANQKGYETFGATGQPPTRRDYPSTTTVDVRPGESPEHRVFEVAYSSDRSDTLTLRFSKGSILLVTASSYVRVGQYEQSRDFSPLPAAVLRPANAKVGQKFSGRFSGEEEGYYNGTVVKREVLTIGGQKSDCIVVDLTTTLTSGQVTGTIHTVTWWDVARALPVRQDADSDVKDSLATYTQNVRVQLTKVTPA